MSIAILKLPGYGLVLHDLGPFAIPVAVLKLSLVPVPMNLIDLSRMTVPLTVCPHSLVHGAIVAPMPSVTMPKSAPEIADIVRLVLASASVRHGADQIKDDQVKAVLG